MRLRGLRAGDVLAGGGAWNREGVVLFGTANTPLMRVSVTGGAPTPATQLTAGQTAHRTPQFLPDGRTFIFTADGDASASGIYLGALDSLVARKLPIASDGAAVFAAPQSLLFRHFRFRVDSSGSRLAAGPDRDGDATDESCSCLRDS